ncbi:hypothetical protein EAVVTKC53_01077 [Elizabethkingia anophelis]|nr:hypothetical protein EAVVTKC53_01946 [Elizabethkingia anophelis]CAI9679673.1 hypothetical protein EAVVTKC53_01077 [Elizabethkingia anophelis]
MINAFFLIKQLVINNTFYSFLMHIKEKNNLFMPVVVTGIFFVVLHKDISKKI